MTTLSPNAKQQFFTNAGAPAAGYRLYTYASGTSTPLATYADKAATTANGNPIILDSRGEAVMYLLPKGYRYVLHDDMDAPIWGPLDNVEPGISAVDIGATGAGQGAQMIAFQQLGTNAIVRTVMDKLDERISVKDFGAVGDGSADDTVAIQAAMTYAGTRNSILVFFPAGHYKVTATIVVPPYTTVAGDGKGCTTVIAATASMTVFTRTFSTYSYAYQHFRDLSISTVLSGVTGMQFTLCESVIVSDVTFMGCTIAVAVDRGQHYTIERVTSEGNASQPAGTFVFTSSVDTDYVFHVTMTDVLCHNVGTGVSLVQGAFIFCRRAVGCAFERILANSLTANNIGGVSQNFLIYENDCQGNRISNCLIVAPKFGIITRTGPGVAVPPTFTSIHNVDVDQATSGSYLFDTALFITVTGGALTPNAGTVAATPIQINTATFITIRGTLIANFTGASAFFFNSSANVTVMGCFISSCLTAFTFAGTSTGIKILGNSAISVTNKTQGTFAQVNNIIRDNTGINPLPITNPAVPSSGTATTNNFGVRCSVYVAGANVTAYAINGIVLSGITNTQTVILEPGDKLNIQYTTPLVWTWVGH